jgi:hypothetical protein
MSDFGLDLERAEQELEEETEGDVILGVLDGSTNPREWIDAVERQNVLFLAIEGDLNTLAAGFAREVREAGGSLMHFRGFLVVTPEDVEIDSDRL